MVMGHLVAYMSQEPECWVFGKLFWKWFQSINLSQSRSLRQLSLELQPRFLIKLKRIIKYILWHNANNQNTVGIEKTTKTENLP